MRALFKTSQVILYRYLRYLDISIYSSTFPHSFIESIQQNTPKAYKYFEEYYSENYDTEKYVFSDLPFEMGLGVFLAFFNHINSDIELYSYEKIYR